MVACHSGLVPLLDELSTNRVDRSDAITNGTEGGLDFASDVRCPEQVPMLTKGQEDDKVSCRMLVGGASLGLGGWPSRGAVGCRSAQSS